MDDPVIGQVGRADRKSEQAVKVEIVGQLKPKEWAELVAQLKQLVKRFPGKLKLRESKYSIKVKKG